MNEQVIADLMNFIERAPARFYRLALLVGPLGSGKTPLIKNLAEYLGSSIVNVNLELSSELLAFSPRSRPFQVAPILADLVESSSEPTLLDNIEILFDPALKLDPLRLLENLSRNRTIIASWQGSLINGNLVYAEPGHPEYHSYKEIDAEVIILTHDERIQR